MKTKLQLEAIKEAYEMIQRGLTNPIKITAAWKYINNIQNMEVPMRAKILAINRFMMLSYQDELQALNKASKAVEDQKLEESIGTIENKDKHSHQEKADVDNDMQQFLTKKQKQELKSPVSGTALEIQSADGKKRRTRTTKKT